MNKLQQCLQEGKKMTFLVGAGLSAESGIPTFRGKDGYWVSGSKNYKAQDIGTIRFFRKDPVEVWKWFLYRKATTEAAKPNTGHLMLKEIEDLLGDQFALISQNIDSLHRKAGNSEERTHLIHGDFDFVRCGKECSKELYPFPTEINLVNRNKHIISDEEWELLKCPKCGSHLRPHVLWFDEYYDELFYSRDSAIKAAEQTGILYVIGTSGATSLPHVITDTVLRKDGLVVEVNISETRFSEMLKEEENGMTVHARSSAFLEALRGQIANAL